MKESPAEDAKTYMSNRQVPQLFESLMTGLMYHRPDDHLGYLIDCIQKVKDSGGNTVNWNAFAELKKSTALPPISVTPNHESSSEDSITAAHQRETSNDITRGSPLPPISRSREATTASRSTPIKVPSNVPLVLVMGPPGSGKLTQCQKVLAHYSKYRWVHLSVGDLLRDRLLKGAADKKWQVIKELIQNGEMAPEEVTQSLIKEALKANINADGILIEGYPKTMDQVDEFNRIVGRVDLAILLDCEEEMCQQRLSARRRQNERIDDNDRAIQRKIDFFKQHTLPVISYFQKEGKLVELSGDRDADEVFYQIVTIIDVAFYGRDPASVAISSLQFAQALPSQNSTASSAARRNTKSNLSSASSLILMDKDEGRREGLPSAPIFFIMGGPGCGKGSQCVRLVERFPGLVHLSMGDILREEIASRGSASDKIDMICDLIYAGEMAPRDYTIDLLLTKLKKHPSARGFLIEGFPRDKKQVEDFNQQIGGLERAILLDCEQETLIKNVEARREMSQRHDDRPAPLERRIDFYKKNTLRLVKYFQDKEKLTIVTVDKKNVDDVHAEIASEVNYIFHADRSASSAALGDSSEANIAVAEEVILPETAHTTGGGSRESTKLSQQKTDISRQTEVSKSSEDSDSSQSTSPSRQPTAVSESKETTNLSQQPASGSKETTNLSKQPTAAGESKEKTIHSQQSAGESKETTNLSQQSASGSKETTNLSKQHTAAGESKETTNLSQQSAGESKEKTNLSQQSAVDSKETTNLSKQPTGMAELAGKKVIFVVGGPGCGKGTQCAKIVDKYGFCHLSSGDLLREEVQSGSERGKELNAIMESGALVSLDIVLTLLKEAMLKNTTAKGFLIDGYPRELEQGTRFEAELVAPACVLYFEVADDVMVERLLGRAKTSGRVDDNEETIKKRLKTFHDHCDQVLAYYDEKKLLCKIDARGQVDDIFGEVVKSIDATN
ncbi:adenylate kinase isoenzyme 5-like isoform X1 [Watersipora subatra]|uniref:adenylate kinase isoenzyme 5-like isoform X1 n=1 Tax=Watersipora subatra TaxID=2589382 RepID=UPI00355BE531